MANASFTRDEVILALDVLYCSDGQSLSKNSPAIAELCELLQELPIHPREGRPENFRNAIYKIAPTGIYCTDDLLVPITDLDAAVKYRPSDYATVCPNCHAALHRIRPWLTRETMEDILR